MRRFDEGTLGPAGVEAVAWALAALRPKPGRFHLQRGAHAAETRGAQHRKHSAGASAGDLPGRQPETSMTTPTTARHSLQPLLEMLAYLPFEQWLQ